MPISQPSSKTNSQFQVQEYDKYSSPKYYFALAITLIIIAVILIFYLIISQNPSYKNTQTQNITSSSNSSSLTLKDSYIASTNYDLTLDLKDKSQSIILPDKLQTYTLTKKCEINALQNFRDKYIITDEMFQNNSFFRITNNYEINISKNSNFIILKYLGLDLNTKFTQDSNIETKLKQLAFDKFVAFTKLDATTCGELDINNFKLEVAYFLNSSGDELVTGTRDNFSLGSVTIYQNIDDTRLVNNWLPLASYDFNSKFETFSESYFNLTIPIFNYAKSTEVINNSVNVNLDDIKKNAFTNTFGYNTPKDLKIQSYEIINLVNNLQTVPTLQINTNYIVLYYKLTTSQ